MQKENLNLYRKERAGEVITANEPRPSSDLYLHDNMHAAVYTDSPLPKPLCMS